ncbi:hypothetical protein KOAAANKH_00718 [Brevundimonas sp. NIBR10]|uniref:hypothetical protein n=1 Tax=Brevundimonas sp. NIBR10 TaxID=3015997 RepID=UPI0022F15FBB|nr:hypothetical protein [Brevundimonas sp. NIBR10]WGM45854.1 hypothetical protein KOAAANKH_00718 [Brevundimonas sp. NIBR10]
MARNRDPFTLALQTLRRLAAEGAFAPDQAIIILDEARRLKLSTTPVREALAWLGGEGMIERSPNGGYKGLRQDAPSIRGRYRLRGALLVSAITDAQQAGDPGLLVASEAEGLNVFLAKIVRLRGDDVLWRAYERVARQLAWLASAEAEVVPGYAGEVEALDAAFRQEPASLAISIERFHHRLEDAAAAILMMARRPINTRDDGMGS